jgi:hypothetical protein
VSNFEYLISSEGYHLVQTVNLGSPSSAPCAQLREKDIHASYTDMKPWLLFHCRAIPRIHSTKKYQVALPQLRESESSNACSLLLVVCCRFDFSPFSNCNMIQVLASATSSSTNDFDQVIPRVCSSPEARDNFLLPIGREGQGIQVTGFPHAAFIASNLG